jgi:hypothetical protein
MVALASAGIARKRARQVAKAFPALARDLGPNYRSAFAAFAEANPPPEGGVLADGLAFGRVVAGERHLSADAKVERMVNRTALNARRLRPDLGGTLVRRPPGVVVIARLPVVGARVFSLRAPRPRAQS